MLQAGADANARTGLGNTPLHSAAACDFRLSWDPRAAQTAKVGEGALSLSLALSRARAHACGSWGDAPAAHCLEATPWACRLRGRGAGGCATRLFLFCHFPPWLPVMTPLPSSRPNKATASGPLPHPACRRVGPRPGPAGVWGRRQGSEQGRPHAAPADAWGQAELQGAGARPE
jgi:hypothetical protein